MWRSINPSPVSSKLDYLRHISRTETTTVFKAASIWRHVKVVSPERKRRRVQNGTCEGCETSSLHGARSREMYEFASGVESQCLVSHSVEWIGSTLAAASSHYRGAEPPDRFGERRIPAHSGRQVSTLLTYSKLLVQYLHWHLRAGTLEPELQSTNPPFRKPHALNISSAG